MLGLAYKANKGTPKEPSQLGGVNTTIATHLQLYMRHPKPLYVLRSQIVLLDTELVEGKVLHWQLTLPYCIIHFFGGICVKFGRCCG